MPDRIELRDLRVLARVGVPERERATAQPLSLDCDLTVDLATPARTDALADTIDYGVLADVIASAARATPTALLERVAGRIVDAVLAADDRIVTARVRVTKIRPPVAHDLATFAVVVERSR